MKKTTLETLLRARLTDSRAMIGSLDINHDRLLLHFGAIGALARVTLSISDNEISIVLPDILALEWRLNEEAKRSCTPLDPAIPLTAELVDGKLRLGSGGPEIILPAGAPAPAAGDLVNEQDVEPNSGAANGATAEAGADGRTPAELGHGANGANGGPAPTPPANAGKWVDFEKVKLDDLKALAAAEGVELHVADNTRREIAAKINVKRGAIDPIGK